ncbi:hypothetical protein DL89DRAFT_263699 [Linderina pennispora]|uniref:Uncharacterized protein n=1 Tax=Linderina pennispora TaxID=61395 RepID=A0A1Y1WJC2_9FUNG|nr:uncharacterized protein DL89DRAFT_263699 [Linderina pennispora]ORX73670.1 hypothetical protein DL89DRAFT_263699 [Linderina pennispora]
MTEGPTVYLPRQQRPRNSDSSRHTLGAEARCGPESSSSSSEISVSNGLARQLQSSSEQIQPNSSREVRLASFLLGYCEDDGSVYLNRLDRGVRSGSGLLVPTAACDSDIVVPLYCGQSRDMVYSEILKPNRTNSISCWFQGTQGGTLGLEFVNAELDLCVSITPAPLPINLGSLSSMLGQLRNRLVQHPFGWLKEEPDGKFTAQFGTPNSTRPCHAWALSGSGNDAYRPVRDAYLELGAPESLHVVWIRPSQDWTSALVRHKQVRRVGPQSRLSARLASVQAHLSQQASCWRSDFSVPDARNTDVIGALRRACLQFGMPVSGSTSTVPPAALASPTYSNTEPITEPETSASSLDDLLEEQRHIRSLLEEQNRLIKAHVSQTREIIHYVKSKPPTQPLTRRYLRMKGAPSHSGANLLTRDTDIEPSPDDTQRSNSLSELVSGIRLFDVEGYEETEHIPRRTPSPSASMTSVVSSSRITSLVSCINDAVSDSSGNGRLPKYTRPPLPPPSRRQHPAGSGSNGSSSAHNNSGARRLARRITSLTSSSPSVSSSLSSNQQ